MSPIKIPFPELKGTESRRQLQKIAKGHPNLFLGIKLAGTGATTESIKRAMINRINEFNRAVAQSTMAMESQRECQDPGCTQCLGGRVTDLESRMYNIDQGMSRVLGCCCVSGTIISFITFISLFTMVRLYLDYPELRIEIMWS